MSHVITANDLSSGLVVYQAADGSWTTSCHAAEVIDDEQRLEQALAVAAAAEKDRLVVGFYAIEVTVEDGAVHPSRYRERIRAFGPSVHPAFGHDQPTKETR